MWVNLKMGLGMWVQALRCRGCSGKHGCMVCRRLFRGHVRQQVCCHGSSLWRQACRRRSTCHDCCSCFRRHFWVKLPMVQLGAIHSKHTMRFMGLLLRRRLRGCFYCGWCRSCRQLLLSGSLIPRSHLLHHIWLLTGGRCRCVGLIGILSQLLTLRRLLSGYGYCW